MDALLLHIDTAHSLNFLGKNRLCHSDIELYECIEVELSTSSVRPAGRRSGHGRALAEREVGHGQRARARVVQTAEMDLIRERILPLHECMRWKRN
jgi:hypothetical protein